MLDVCRILLDERRKPKKGLVYFFRSPFRYKFTKVLGTQAKSKMKKLYDFVHILGIIDGSKVASSPIYVVPGYHGLIRSSLRGTLGTRLTYPG